MPLELSARTASLIAAFLEEERPKVTEQGYKSIERLVRQVGYWLDEAELEAAEVSIREALAWQCTLAGKRNAEGRPYQAGTVNNHLKAARRFFDYLVKTGAAYANPFRTLRRVKIGDHLSENALTVEQMGRLLDSLSRFDELTPWWRRLKVYRVHAAAELMYSAGLRAAEAAALEPVDLDLASRTVWVRSGRSGQGRTAFLTNYATDVLGEYLKQRSALFHSYERVYGHTLFGTGYERLREVVNEVLAETCAALGLPMITSYGFRTSLGAHLVEAGCDLRHVQLLLGFRNLGSTQTYLRRCKESLRNAVDAAHPRASWEAKS